MKMILQQQQRSLVTQIEMKKVAKESERKKTMAVNFKLVWIYFCAPRITNLLGPYYMLLYRCFYDKLQL